MMDQLVEYLPIIAGLLAAGAAAGFLAGLLGVGGGIVMVPALSVVFPLLGVHEDMAIRLAIATSMATALFTSVSSVRAHYRKLAVDVDVLKSWWLFIAGGAIAGAVSVANAPPEALKGVFAIMTLGVAAYMMLVREGTCLRDGLPPAPAGQAIPFGIGWISAMMGIGGATLTVPALTLCRWPVHRAVGTAAAVGFLIALPATAGFLAGGFLAPAPAGAVAATLPPFTIGYVSFLAMALMVPVSMGVAPLGAKLAHVLSARTLRIAFGVFLVIVSLRMFAGILL